MFGCCSTSVVKEDEPLIVDLCEVLRDKAWASFRASRGPFQKLTQKRKDFVFEVPENYFDFEDIKQEKSKRTLKISDTQSSQGSTYIEGTDGSGLVKGKMPSKRETNPETVTLDTEFSNETAERQMYKFRFEKTRRSEIEVTFQKGFTFGGKANFSIKFPLTDFGVEAEKQYQVTKSDGQIFEESLLMEATSDIAVGPNSRYTANIQLEEKALHTNFTITTRMSMPQERAPVYLKRRLDGETVYVYYVKNLVDIFKDAVPCVELVKNDSGKIDYTKLDFVIQGVVKGVIACNHKISLTSNEPDQVKKDARTRYRKAIAERACDPRDEDR